MGSRASPHPVLWCWESVQIDVLGKKCVKIILNSYGIVVTLVPSLYNSLFFFFKVIA